MSFIRQNPGMRWYWLLFAALAVMAVVETLATRSPWTALAAVALAVAAVWSYRLRKPPTAAGEPGDPPPGPDS